VIHVIASAFKQVDPNAIVIAFIAGLPGILTAILSARNHSKLRQVNHAVRDSAQASQSLADAVTETCLNGEKKTTRP